MDGTACSLKNNEIGDAGAAVIGEALKVNTMLSTLWCAEGVCGRAMAMARKLTLGIHGGVRSLYNNQIGVAGAAAIGEALQTNNALTKLECVDCSLR